MTDEISLQLVFTGKVAIIVESNWGPIEFSANDIDLAFELVRVIMGDSKGILNVDSYSEEDSQTMKKMLGRINDSNSE